jgi:hypothetical protein
MEGEQGRSARVAVAGKGPLKVCWCLQLEAPTGLLRRQPILPMRNVKVNGLHKHPPRKRKRKRGRKKDKKLQ